MPNGGASHQQPIMIGRIKPSDRYRKIADANAQAVCVPRPSARARRYIRTHHSRIEAVRKKAAIPHQPPSFSGGMLRPYAGAGGSRPSQKSWRTNCAGLQSTAARKLKPMISIAMNAQMIDATPLKP